MDISTLIVTIAVGLAVLIFAVAKMYVKAPPSVAFILSGFRKEPRVLVGSGGFQVPILERLDKVWLGQITVDVKTNRPVPTNDFIDVSVDAVCKVRVIPTDEGTRLASKNFLNMEPEDICKQITDSLEGNMREVIGALKLIDINTNRDAFSDQILAKAAPDMMKLGLEIISCNIQNVWDEKGLIKDMGADNTYAIKKNAAITKANAEKDIAIAEQEAKKAANDIRVKTETEIAERNNELAIRQADLKKVADAKQAEADAAYEIQRQEQQKTINTKTVDAEIERTKREQILSEEKIKITENTLKSEINAKADAAKYQTEVDAQALLERQKREAEAQTYLAEQEAKAVKAKADAAKYAAFQEAEGIKAKGEAAAVATKLSLEAEAAGILAKGNAEAEAMNKKAEAYEKYGHVAVIDMITKMAENVLPQVAENVAKPMSSISNVTVYGTTGGEVAGLSQNVPTVIKQTFDVVKDVTGVDLADVMKSNTISAKTDKNINLGGASANVDVNVQPQA